MTEKNQENSTVIDYNELLLEMSNIQDFISQHNSGAGMVDISLKDVYNLLRNPYKNIQKVQNTSRYFSNRFGIVKDVNEAFKSMPTLNHHIVWSNYDNPAKIAKYEKRIYDLLENINIKKVVRDGLGEQAEAGTVVAVNRKNKFIQFLDLDKVRIAKQINGRWVVEIDLSTISGSVKEITAQIDSLPEDVTLAKYNLFRQKGEEYRFVEIKGAYVLSIRGTRNFPYGLPLTLSAWATLLHKALIEQVEKSVADRKIKSLLVLYVNSILQASEPFKPPSKEVINNYFKELTNVIKKKDKGGNTGSETVGTGVLTLPSFFDLKEIKIDTEMFSKEVYEKIDNDVFANLGVSSALIYGSGSSSNYGVSQMNSEKFFRYIFTALEDWEYMVNDMIKNMLPNDLNCKFYFDRTAIGDKDKDITAKHQFYMQTGVWIPWAEAVLGVPYTYALGIKQYQDKILSLEDVIRPPQNAYTQSGGENKGGRPENDPNDNKTSNIKAKGNNSNSIPSPSD